MLEHDTSTKRCRDAETHMQVLRGMSPPKVRHPNKWEYLYVVRGDYGYGWEDLTQSGTRAEAVGDLRAYRTNSPEGVYRVVRRREVNPDWIAHVVQGALVGTGYAMCDFIDMYATIVRIRKAMLPTLTWLGSTRPALSEMLLQVLSGPCSACCTDDEADCLRIETEIAHRLTPNMVK